MSNEQLTMNTSATLRLRGPWAKSKGRASAQCRQLRVW